MNKPTLAHHHQQRRTRTPWGKLKSTVAALAPGDSIVAPTKEHADSLRRTFTYAGRRASCIATAPLASRYASPAERAQASRSPYVVTAIT